VVRAAGLIEREELMIEHLRLSTTRSFDERSKWSSARFAASSDSWVSPACLPSAYRRARRVSDAMADDDFVPVSGVVYLGTSPGVFLNVEDLRVFIPANCQ
jgi:hypothetical protein